MINVLIVDDHKFLRECFEKILESHNDFNVVGSASNGFEAFKICNELSPDIVLMDITMPICNGIDATKLIKSKFPNIKVLIITGSENEADVSNAIRNGADGYILKSIGTEELIISIRSALLGFEIIQKCVFKFSEFPSVPYESKQKTKTLHINDIKVELSERELNIIQMITDGYTNKEISSKLYIAEGTVKNAITEIITKLQLRDRTQLAVYAIRNNLI
ncbi:MAG: DNA-binding response regulator [Firmicutes bacterium HGW-Firmicutes-1]|jgi:DNA-binding NarL/FixJ family response regulator|nr:MAG: DNA-binding response regulator [Firmicutes bacterium HGW-Firmicutes-1]